MMYNGIMRKIGIIVTILLAIVFASPARAVDTSNFYFDDFTGDYYLTKDQDNISHLRVKERFTAVFPEFDQNKGFCRVIPYTNQGGLNVTLPDLTRNNIKLTRNDVPEPIYSIDKISGDKLSKKNNGHFVVCTGTEEYVHGKQVYEFEYSFERVVTKFEKDGKPYQELYWDTNGDGWTQKFNKVTARLHFADEKVYGGESWCYVGAYGDSDTKRCKTTKIEDGLEFETSKLARGENLTFVVLLKADSFKIVQPEKSYIYIVLMVAVVALAILIIWFRFKKFLATREKARFYKGYFVKPEYQPSKDYSLPEMSEIYLGKKKDVKVAMLLELVVKHKIVFQKQDKRKWKVLVKNLDGVEKGYLDLLAILNGGTTPKVGDEIVLKRQTATSHLIRLRTAMEESVVGSLKNDKLVEEKYHFGDSKARGIGNIVVMTIFLVPMMVMFGIMALVMIEDILGLNEAVGKIFVGKELFYPLMFALIVITVIISVALSDAAMRYDKHTVEGLKASRYMDGLKLYIGMAESERMKMLQSVKGADTSAEGIVKLYEKLLPYAAVFGLEESWMDEMKEYCKVEDIEEPDYLMTGIATSEISRSLRNAASLATSASSMSSSGGGSSGSSGSFGGGFSGGGGGGGGGFGR